MSRSGLRKDELSHPAASSDHRDLPFSRPSRSVAGIFVRLARESMEQVGHTIAPEELGSVDGVDRCGAPGAVDPIDIGRLWTPRGAETSRGSNSDPLIWAAPGGQSQTHCDQNHGGFPRNCATSPKCGGERMGPGPTRCSCASTHRAKRRSRSGRSGAFSHLTPVSDSTRSPVVGSSSADRRATASDN